MVGDIFQPTHLLFVLVVALLVLGPKRLPEVARQLGNGLRDFRAAISGESRHEDEPSHEIVYTPDEPHLDEPQDMAAFTDKHDEAAAVHEDDPAKGEDHHPEAEPTSSQDHQPQAQPNSSQDHHPEAEPTSSQDHQPQAEPNISQDQQPRADGDSSPEDDAPTAPPQPVAPTNKPA